MLSTDTVWCQSINFASTLMIKWSSKLSSDSWARQTAEAQQHFCTGQSFDWNWTPWWRLELTMRRLCVVLLSTARRISRKRPTPRVRLLWECREKTGRERWSDSEVCVFLEGGLSKQTSPFLLKFGWCAALSDEAKKLTPPTNQQHLAKRIKTLTIWQICPF